MALTERKEHKLEIIPPYSVIQCREATIVEKTEDGKTVEVGRAYHRSTFYPGDDVSKECDEVKSVAAALWTPAVIAAYEASLPPAPVEG